MNKEVMGIQQTILFYVDDIKMSHVKESVLLDTGAELKKVRQNKQLECEQGRHTRLPWSNIRF